MCGAAQVSLTSLASTPFVAQECEVPMVDPDTIPGIVSYPSDGLTPRYVLHATIEVAGLLLTCFFDIP